jgi:hypothetical protein
MPFIKQSMLFFMLITFSDLSFPQDISTSPQELANRIFRKTTHTPSPAALISERLHQPQGVDYDHCISSGSPYVHIYTLQLNEQQCLILSQDKHSNKINGILISGPNAPSTRFRFIVYDLIDLIEEKSPLNHWQKARLHLFLTLHEWYNSSKPINVSGFDYRYYTDLKHRLFIITPHNIE